MKTFRKNVPKNRNDKYCFFFNLFTNDYRKVILINIEYAF